VVIVDTNAWIEMLRRKGDPLVKLAMNGLLSQYEAFLCGPVEMELLGGMPSEQRSRLSSWLSVIPRHRCGDDLWRNAGESYSLLRANGLTVPWNDVLVASVSLLAQCRVYSTDRHFHWMAPILGLSLYNPGHSGIFNPDD